MGIVRKLSISTLALAAVSTLSIGYAAAQEVVLGVFVPTTGVLAPLGNDMKNGFELAAQGATVKGRPVRLVIEDTAANPANGLRKAQKLVLEDKATLLIGGAASSVTLGINAQSARLNVPIITTNAQAVGITGEQCSRFLFRTVPNDAMSAKASAIMMQERKDLLNKNWFVIYHDFAYGISNKAEFAKIPGIKIAGEAGRPVGTADWSSAIAQIQASKADGVYLALAVGDDLTAFVNQARGFGINFPMMTPVGIPDSMLQALGKNGVGMVAAALTTSWTQEDSNPKIAEMVKAYHAKFGIVPGYQAIQAYAGLQFTLAALNAASELNTDTIIKSLETTSADTVVGTIKIRKEDHQGMLGAYISEAQALPKEKFGATVAWKTLTPLTWEQTKIELANTGCKGL
ncbi:MAG: branched-chain amino acid ABC transporter substrate-binding protein [Rhizobiales bacterium 62-47]|nr:ABC transporter substrate-binding protein [Hyphomicrobiales bacterium]OJY08981.1 MAG: branched-chain amino acid ABC transporter substrate-binding protein [Rhizobiales bacterium 62-47]